MGARYDKKTRERAKLEKKALFFVEINRQYCEHLPDNERGYMSMYGPADDAKAAQVSRLLLRLSGVSEEAIDSAYPVAELRGMERGGEGLAANAKNIHGEILPEKYRFTEEDEKRLDDLDFYTHRGDAQLPPASITEADRFMAWRWYGQFMVPCTEERLGAMAWRISRERQLLATLSVTDGVDGREK